MNRQVALSCFKAGCRAWLGNLAQWIDSGRKTPAAWAHEASILCFASPFEALPLPLPVTHLFCQLVYLEAAVVGQYPNQPCASPVAAGMHYCPASCAAVPRARRR